MKRCVFGGRIQVDSRPKRRKSNVFFQTKPMRVDRAYYYFLCELPDVIKLCQTTRRCARRWRPVRNETPVIHGQHIVLIYTVDFHKLYKKRDLLMTKSICSGKYVYLLNVLITNALCIYIIIQCNYMHCLSMLQSC